MNSDSGKNYEATTTTAVATPMSSSDFMNESIGFYWKAPGTGSVNCTVTINSVEFEVEGSLNVLKPTSTLTTVTGRMGIAVITPENGPPYIGLRFGVPDAGITFTGTYSVPNGFSGDAQLWQKVNSTFSYWEARK